MKFSCMFCKCYFEQEHVLYSHVLFTHGKFIQPCSTNLAEKQCIEYQAIREQYDKIKKFRNSRRNRIIHHINKWKSKGGDRQLIDIIHSICNYLESLEQLQIVNEVANKKGVVLEI